MIYIITKTSLLYLIQISNVIHNKSQQNNKLLKTSKKYEIFGIQIEARQTKNS